MQTLLSSDRSNDPYNFKDGLIRPVLKCDPSCPTLPVAAQPGDVLQVEKPPVAFAQI
jgi:hypothetical protein